VAEDPLDPHGEEEEASVLEAAPVVARLAAGAAWRSAGWALGAIRDLLGLDEIEQRVYGGERNGDPTAGDPTHPHTLRERGQDLLERSADIALEEETHPAYERILDQLAPDEARILRLLATKGARPAVDVRTWRPLGIGSQTVAPGLSMIGAEAGCTYTDGVPAYLNNLFRLGLIWFSREPLDDPNLYQVLEVQPDVLEAMRRAGRTSTMRRSIHLTPFGVDFCETCIPLSTVE
jgi:hypothetical protein